MSGDTETIDIAPADHVTRTRRIDLDAARAARAEARRQAAGEEADAGPPVLVIGGEELPLAEELPLSALTAFGELMALKDITEGDEVDFSAIDGLLVGCGELFGEEVWARVRPGMSIEDLMFLLEEAMALYGMSLGESSASGAPSSPTGEPSRPTSTDTTDSA